MALPVAGSSSADAPQQSGGAGDGYLKLTVPLLQQGQFRQAKTMVA